MIDTKTIAERAEHLISTAAIEADPFPHLLVDGIFPEAFYEEILRNLPPREILSVPVTFGMMKIGDDDQSFRSLPKSGQEFWTLFDRDVKQPIFAALIRRWLPFAEEKLTLIFGADAARAALSELQPEEFTQLRGIVQYRITGARMGPHVDKATSLFTYLFYFASDDSLRPFGTIFYKAHDLAKVIEGYRANKSIRAWFPPEGSLDLSPRAPLEFRRNRLVSYANLPYALHGAATDAVAPRYSMQSFCDFPLRLTMQLYEGWKDAVSPTGFYRGDG